MHAIRNMTRTLLATKSISQRRWLSVASTDTVRIVEVGPRDGLQNEKGIIPVETKVELIDRLASAGLRTIEAGSFVSPKWVPQMAGTSEVLSRIKQIPGVHYPVLVPNQKGLDNLLASSASLTDEIAIFASATDEFSTANLNVTVRESLERFAPVARAARDKGYRVRGYVSVVISCPYSGAVKPESVREVAKELVEMGCYEISLGDTVGMGTPHQVSAMLESVQKDVPVGRLAGHFHDTYGTAIANVFAALASGVRTIDSSIGGLGGCPYSPGATGNVATEDVVYALQNSPYRLEGEVDLQQLVDIGWWINKELGRENVSRAGRALHAKAKL